MANNMYRVGDCVYFETSSSAPYQIRRIEELCKTPTGNVEAKVMSFYRRRDLSQNLISLADKHQLGGSDEENGGGSVASKEELTERQKHQLKHRELFLSRQIETLPATHIRGKCSITLLNETEEFCSYLTRDDSFFYSLVYDPQQKTLLADKGEIRVGPRFQADTPPLLKQGESDKRDLKDLEELVWSCDNPLTDQQIDNFLMLARSVGTFARSLDCSSTVKQPSLHMSAAAASRDITLFHGMHLLHKTNYKETEAMNLLVPSTGPVLCRDELEEWSSAEASMFEEALDKNGKDFFEIRNEVLSWKTHKALVEYYYMWKTTDRYVQQKRIKAAEAESKLKQVYIPTYNKVNPAQIADKGEGRKCESCLASTSSQWYSWGPPVMQGRVCGSCWNYWKKYGGLKLASRSDTNNSNGYNNHNNTTNNNNSNNGSIKQSINKAFKCSAAGCEKSDFRSKSHFLQHLTSQHGISSACNSPCAVMKTRAAFCLVTTPLTRLSRQVCKPSLDIKRAARHPFIAININNIKLQCQQRLSDSTYKPKTLKESKRVDMMIVSARLGIPTDVSVPVLLSRREGTSRKRKNEEVPSNVEPPIKVINIEGDKETDKKDNNKPYDVKHSLPKSRGTRRAVRSILKEFKCEEMVFIAVEAVKQQRKNMATQDVKRIGRKPCRHVI